jgi:hypothetical protein
VITKATLGPQNWTNPTPKPTLATPVLLTPKDGSLFGHYPRTTVLTWQPVPGATKYRVEREFYGGVWVAYPVVEVASTSFTFDFVGAQPGRWRVTALDDIGGTSLPSDWWNFRYTV